MRLRKKAITRFLEKFQKKARREEGSGQGGPGVGRFVPPGAVAPSVVFAATNTCAVKCGSVDAARGADALGELLPGFLLGGRQRIVEPASDPIVRVRRLACAPVFREFGGESVHDRLVAVVSLRLPQSNSRATGFWTGRAGGEALFLPYGGRRIGTTSADGDRRRHRAICRISPTANVAIPTTA